MTAVSLSQELTSVSQRGSPKTVAEFGGHDVKVVKVKGVLNRDSNRGTHPEQGAIPIVRKCVERCSVAQEDAEPLGTDLATVCNGPGAVGRSKSI